MKLAVLFDIDGTLLDSARSLKTTYRELCEKNKLEPNLEGFRALLGATLEQILATLHPARDSLTLAREFRKMANSNDVLIKPFEGAQRMVMSVLEAGIDIGYLTSKDLSRASAALARHNFATGKIYSPGPGIRAKPFPDSFLQARREMEIGYGLYVGDTESDFIGANSAGFDFIFANWGYGSPPKGNFWHMSASPKHAAKALERWIAEKS